MPLTKLTGSGSCGGSSGICIDRALRHCARLEERFVNLDRLLLLTDLPPQSLCVCFSLAHLAREGLARAADLANLFLRAERIRIERILDV